MVAAAVFAYFLIVVLGVVLVLFPECRQRVVAALAGAFNSSLMPFVRAGGLFSVSVARVHGSAMEAVSQIRTFIFGKPLLSIVALMLVGAPALMAFFAHAPAVFDLAVESVGSDRQIAILLQGEQLIPPSPLPPEVFTTREVEMVRPDVAVASRNWQLLDQDFTQRLLVVFRLMKERHGYEMVLIEGYRSPERQARLYEQGAHVTQVGANMSYHQHGLAADSAFFRDGKVVISERDPWAMRGYQLYGEIAAQVGLTWGGNWKMQDYGHVELRRPGVLGRVASQ